MTRLSTDVSADDRTTYNILPGSSQRGTDKLFDSNGYTYSVVRTNCDGSRLWRCTVRGKNACRATVKQRDGGYAKGLRDHNHGGKVGAYEAALVAVETAKRAMAQPFKSAARIAEEVVQEQYPEGRPLHGLQKIEYLARNANNARCRTRPLEPRTTNFTLSVTDIPENFVVGDIQTQSARHILFATERQMALLRNVKTWYVDATFEVVREPFSQLFSIHGFVRSGEATKQVPLLYCVMSRRRRKDYVAVFSKVMELVGDARVKRLLTDFEQAVWRAVTAVMPNVELKGCSFHYAQAVFRKITSLGLKRYYKRRNTAHLLMRQLMCLCYLPSASIEPVFNRLRRKNSDRKLDELFQYMHTTWIENSVWSTNNLSVYGTAIRTNNDLEGWHNRLNKYGKRKMPFYMLVDLIHGEAEFAEGQVQVISEGKVMRRRRRQSVESDKKLYELWQDFKDGKKTAKRLLKDIALSKLLAH